MAIVEKQGRATIHIICKECGKLSPTFSIYLSNIPQIPIFIPGAMPEGWIEEDRALLYGDIILGYCPDHK